MLLRPVLSGNKGELKELPTIWANEGKGNSVNGPLSR